MMQPSRPVVLVVDDGPKNIRLMEGILVPAGYTVISADNGAGAIEMARATLPDLILLDVMMPGMDGFAVCKHLKEVETTRHLPVIFVTARSDMETETRCFALGAVDFITKPVNMPVVLARVKMHLALERQRRSLEGMFEDVIEFAPDAFVLCDPQGSIGRINSRAEQMFGYRREDLVGRSVVVLMPNGLARGTSLRCLRSDGSEFPADINVSPLQTHRGSLVMAVVRDVTDRQKAEQSLVESRRQLRLLIAQNEARREVERKHMAREVHDELGQLLTGLRMEMSLVEMRFGNQNAGLAEKVQGMKSLLDRAIQGVRHVVANLRPTALDMGLVAALESVCTEFAQRAGIVCEFQTREQAVVLDEARAVVVFRIVQESLTNVMRHAGASHVRVTLGCEGSALGVEVRDNGKGFDLSAAAGAASFGLLGVRERAHGLGGRVDIVSAPGRGTVVGLTIPLDEAALAKDEA